MSESFVNVWFSDTSTDTANHSKQASFYKEWANQASAKHTSPFERAADALRKVYPTYSLVLSTDWALDIFNDPAVIVKPLDDIPLLTSTIFVPLSRMGSQVPGLLQDIVYFGGFNMIWQGKEFLVYMLEYTLGFGNYRASLFLHDGPEDAIRLFLLANGIWRNELHSEIWVFNQGYWSKDTELYIEVQKANWDDVILKDEFKKNLQKDVDGFFTSADLYKKLAIPWKRGLIMWGPPGNGKTISLKAIMKSCAEKGYAPLYVKSFKSFMGEEYSMTQVFNKARQLAPCIIVLEDLDSLINDSNRSFFLNQLDGLSGNDGLFLIGTTNHFDRLDPGLSQRPSRFDRKYKFDDPDHEERSLYILYWQNKLKDNEGISFPDSLVKDVADWTSGFSFAYLKEAFVSSLVTLAGYEEKEKPEFADLLKKQIDTLREQLDKSITRHQSPGATSHPEQIISRDLHRLVEPLSQPVVNTQSRAKVFTTWDPRKDYRSIFDRIAQRTTSGPMIPGGWGQSDPSVAELPVLRK